MSHQDLKRVESSLWEAADQLRANFEELLG